MIDKSELEITEETATARTVLVLIVVSLVISVVCFGIASSILPEYCELFSSNIPSGLLCDGLDLRNPQPCPVCRDRGTAMVAQVFAGMGIASLVLPGFVFFLRNRRNLLKESTHLID